MSDFAQVPATGELATDNGDLAFDADRDAVAADLRQRCSLIFGEWFLAPDEGVRLFEDLIGKKGVTSSIVRSVYEATILGTPGVVSIARFDVTIDRAARSAAVDFEVSTDLGLIEVTL
jgi:hypothetical protein